MNLSLLATRALGSTNFFLRKNAPTILTGAGVAGFIATTALTIRATNKANDILPVISDDVAMVKDRDVTEQFSQQQKNKALVQVYAQSTLRLTKVYGPVFLVGSASIACVLAGHGMMLKRQANLAAAYVALDTAYKAYRARVIDKLGVEEEQKLYRGVKTVQSVDEAGEPCEIIDLSDVMPSRYAKFFDQTNPNWVKTAEFNLMFLRGQQQYANDRLQAQGFVFLNEVHEWLGLERTQYGQAVGWKRNANIKGTGDGFISFGLYDIFNEDGRAFVNGREASVLLDFNVDGVIQI